jgi:membrane protease YdiL (CAAX protease family)
MITLEHALALFLLVGVPVWDVFETRALKTGTNPRRKIFSYQRIVVVLWAATFLVWFVLRSQVFFVWPAATHSAAAIHIGSSFVLGFVVALLVGFLMPTVLVRRSPKFHGKMLRACKRLVFILPDTREERAWFTFISLTAGICEEVLYRGFLIRYLSESPWHTGLWMALAISSIAFGMTHGYQGVSGILGTAVIGAVMGVVFVVTGSLLLPWRSMLSLTSDSSSCCVPES